MLGNEMIDLRKKLESLPTGQLSAMLQAEVKKDVPDDDLVILLLHILEDREPDEPGKLSSGEEKAWKLYQKRVRSRSRKPLRSWRSLANVAVLLLVVGILFTAIPQEVQADSWWERLARWTDEFFGFFREEEDPYTLADYEFRTDNPGLQQVYDAVVEMGVADPVVPMWLPDGYELVELKKYSLPSQSYIMANFSTGEKSAIIKISVLKRDEPIGYFKEEDLLNAHEQSGVVHNILRNEKTWSVLWARENIECSIFIDCQEDLLYEIIESIYRWRINE